MSFSAALKPLRRSIAALLAVLVTVVAGLAQAQEDVQKPAGPWVVTEAQDASNIGMVFYFSPDGTFGLVDPKTKIGAAGTYSVGRAGLMINVFNVGKSAEFIVGDLSLSGDNMVIDVKRSAVMEPQRVVLQSVKVIPPLPALTAPAKP